MVWDINYTVIHDDTLNPHGGLDLSRVQLPSPEPLVGSLGHCDLWQEWSFPMSGSEIGKWPVTVSDGKLGGSWGERYEITLSALQDLVQEMWVSDWRPFGFLGWFPRQSDAQHVRFGATTRISWQSWSLPFFGAAGAYLGHERLKVFPFNHLTEEALSFFQISIFVAICTTPLRLLAAIPPFGRWLIWKPWKPCLATAGFSGCNTPKFYSGGTAETSSIAVGAGTPCCDFIDEAGCIFKQNHGKEMGIYKGRMWELIRLWLHIILVMLALNSF